VQKPAKLTRGLDAAAILRCLHETLRERAFAGVLVRLVAGRPHLGASGKKSMGH